MHGLGKFLSIKCVENFAAREPAAPGHGDAIGQIVQVVDRMSVGGDNEFDAASARRANPARFQIEPARIAVDLDGAAGLGDGVEHFFHVASEGRARWDQASERMAPDFEEGRFERAQ